VSHFLRHTAVCLWLALLLAAGAGLWLMPALQAVAGLEALPFAAAGMLTLAFVGIGWIGTRLGLQRVRHGLRAAERAERDGRPEEAEAGLRAALAALDRPWVSAAARRRTVPLIGARLARHYLAGARLDARGAAFVDAYLRHVPEDEDVAEGWAAQAELRGGLTEDQQELAGRLFRRHPDNAVIARVAARLFLLLERRDYDALQCYRRACALGEGAPEELRAELERALGRAGGAEAPQRPVAGRAAAPAAARQADRAPERSGPAAPWAEEDEPEPPFRMTAPATAEAEDEEPQHAVARSWGPRMRAGLRAAGVGLSGVLRAWSSRLRVLQTLGRTLAARQVLGATVVAGLGAILVWLVATAMSDYFSRPPETPVAAEAPAVSPPPAITDDPYTLQVAAYLKQEYALRLVEDLTRKGIDAYWTETSSGGKVYYQVRISHFRDQQSARDFGRSLKRRGLIEDFYVTNYVR
jgi:hypothetical protein